MKAYLKIGGFLLFIGLFSNCVFQGGHPIYVGVQDHCGFAVNQYTGEGLRWSEDKFPVSFYVHHSVPNEAKENFISAVNHWNLAWTEYLKKEGLKPFPPI